MRFYRVEHRTEDSVEVVAYTSDVYASQQGLSRYAADLFMAGATGEVVLVDETTGDEVARRLLRIEIGELDYDIDG